MLKFVVLPSQVIGFEYWKCYLRSFIDHVLDMNVVVFKTPSFFSFSIDNRIPYSKLAIILWLIFGFSSILLINEYC